MYAEGLFIAVGMISPEHTIFLYIGRMIDPKPVDFRGSSLDDLRAFPLPAQLEASHQFDQVQHGQEPDDWKPMALIDKGVKEIRIRDAAGALRIICVAKLGDIVYVLHCFQKKTEKTSSTDLDLAAKRYCELQRELGASASNDMPACGERSRTPRPRSGT